jgi:nucleolar protein 56
MHYLATNPLGLFVFDEKNKLVKFIYLGNEPEEAARKLALLEKGDLPELSELKAEFSDLVVEQPNQASSYLRENFRRIVLDSGRFKSETDLNQFLNAIMIAKSRLNISKIERRDKMIIQAVNALGDVEKIANTIIERIREWYGLHYPELNVSDHEKYASLIAQYGDRKNFPEFRNSMGMELRDDDVSIIQDYAVQFKELSKVRKDLEKYIEITVKEEMPNLNVLLGSTLAARLLALAGSLEKMAKMPSSSIQLLGAEKSLFKFMKGKEKSRPPRFGILYLHPDISTSRRDLQGKIARVLSSKLTLAARTDFYTKKDVSKELLEEYKRKVEEIKLQPAPPIEAVPEREYFTTEPRQDQRPRQDFQRDRREGPRGEFRGQRQDFRSERPPQRDYSVKEPKSEFQRAEPRQEFRRERPREGGRQRDFSAREPQQNAGRGRDFGRGRGPQRDYFSLKEPKGENAGPKSDFGRDKPREGEPRKDFQRDRPRQDFHRKKYSSRR